MCDPVNQNDQHRNSAKAQSRIFSPFFSSSSKPSHSVVTMSSKCPSPLSGEFISSIIGLDDTNQTIKKVSKEQHITSLWAGYGTISSVEVTIMDTSTNNSPSNKKQTTKSLIIKRVKPPSSSSSSIGNQRKLKSYHIEGLFYNELAPLLIHLKQMDNDNSIPCQIATPYFIETAEASMDSSSSPSFTFILEDLSIEYSESYSSSLSSIDQTKQAIRWLAFFHSTFFRHSEIINMLNKNDNEDDNSTCTRTVNVWEQGGYWHLQTRLDEWNSIPSYQSYFQKSAHAIDERMNELGNGHSHTLIHGDYKDANVLFGDSGIGNDSAAVVDFQYCGVGYGVKDLVMWVVSSIPSKTFHKLGGEDGVLRFYHDELCKSTEQINKFRQEQQQQQEQDQGTGLGEYYDEGDLEQFTNFDNIKMQFELALVDYVRFMAGWGMWGSNSDYAEKRAVQILKDIAGSTANMKKFEEEDWRKAIYEKYPLTSF